MNWEALVTQVLKTAGLAVIGTLAAKVVSETESQLAKTETTGSTHITYLKQELKNLSIR
jgi:DNA-directed RNA polymerase alpha subunit